MLFSHSADLYLQLKLMLFCLKPENPYFAIQNNNVILQTYRSRTNLLHVYRALSTLSCNVIGRLSDFRVLLKFIYNLFFSFKLTSDVG